MLIIELTYKKSLAIVDSLLDEHKRFLAKYYAQGIFIASGPKNPRDGGVILALSDKEEIFNILQEDPFFREEVADYVIIQFEPTKVNQTIFNNLE